MIVRLGLVAAALLTTAACADQASVAGPDVRLPVSESPASTGGPDLNDATLWLSFDEKSHDFDGRKVFPDALEGPYDGREMVANDGAVKQVPGAPGRGSAVAFPPMCPTPQGCPRALLEIPDDPALDPGEEDFTYGASVRLDPQQTTTGSNIVQKGRYAASDSLWKLQVDNDAGHPSCVVRSGSDLMRVRSGVSIADGSWHRVTCSKIGDGLAIEVDGVGRHTQGRIGPVTSQWPVRIGAPGVGDHDDQFHGLIDDVFLRVDPAD